MKEDKAITAVGIMAVILSLLMFSVGRFIMGGITLLLAFGVFWNRGGGKRSDRIIYEKFVNTDLSIDAIFESLRDMETPLGKAWIGGHSDFGGDCIIFGPCSYKDCVVIARNKGTVNVKHVTRLDKIIRREEDEYRFEGLADGSEAEVTPERYAVFAGFKLISVVMVRHIAELIGKLSEDRGTAIPDSLDMYRFYYHNSAEGFFRDSQGRDVLKADYSVTPFKARVLDTDGELMAAIEANGLNRRGEPADSAGFELLTDEGHFGEIRRFRDKSGEGFIADTEAGEFRAVLFPACMKARIACNYMIEHNGKPMAVIGGSPNILFDGEGWCRNDLVCSFDDDYLVLYAALELFILTLNSKFLK